VYCGGPDTDRFRGEVERPLPRSPPTLDFDPDDGVRVGLCLSDPDDPDTELLKRSTPHTHHTPHTEDMMGVVWTASFVSW
jgi:hypothetical protein